MQFFLVRLFSGQMRQFFVIHTNGYLIGYLDIVKWRTSYCYVSVPNLTRTLVVHECGAIPDIEDKEGEVSSSFYSHT